MQVLKRINSEIEARRKAGENLPPPPKTAIAGPEYFGLNQPEVTENSTASRVTCLSDCASSFKERFGSMDSINQRSVKTELYFMSPV